MSKDEKAKDIPQFCFDIIMEAWWDWIRALFLLRLGGDKARINKYKLKSSCMICCGINTRSRCTFFE